MVSAIEKLIGSSYMLGLIHAEEENPERKINAADETEIPEIPFNEAMQFLKSKVPMSKAEWLELEPKLRFRAFTVAQLGSAEVVDKAKQILLKSFEKGGGTYSDTWEELKKKVNVNALGIKPGYWENVFRTNTQSAYIAGKLQQYENTGVAAYQLMVIEDGRTSKICRHLLTASGYGMIISVDHPFWKKYGFPPYHFQCRTSIRAIWPSQVGKLGNMVENPTMKSLSKFKVQEGFGGNPLERGSWWEMTDNMKRLAEKFEVMEKIEAAKEILVEHKPEKNAINFKSLDDIKKYMLDNITDEVDLDIKQSDLPVLNNIANLLNQRLTEFGLPKFTKITNVRNRNVLASIEDDVLKLNISKLKNPSSVLKRLEDYEKKYGFRHSVLGDKDDVIRSTLDHELGHRVYANSSLGNKQKILTELFAKGTKWQAPFDIARDVSYYAYQGGESETIAELFSMYKHPLEIKKMPLEYKNFVKDLIRNTTKNKIKMEEQFLTLTDKQFGKKGSKHAPEWGLKMNLPQDRQKLKDIILDIYNNADYTLRNADWRGQPKPVTFYVKGDDVVVVNADDEFITILKGGVHNARVIAARLKNTGK